MKTYRLILLGLTISLPILSLAKDGHYARCDALTLANPPEDIRPLAPVAMQAMPNAKAAAAPSRTMTVKAKKQRIAPHPVVNTEKYQHLAPNPVHRVTEQAVSTFSIDVDTGSYANVRRFLLKDNKLPPQDAVRIEEFINYFDYHYDLPTGEAPFALSHSVIDSPWQKGAKLLRIGLQAKDVDKTDLPPANLVFLIDTSGSMHAPSKLALAQKTVCYFAANLREKDTLSIITYAGYTKTLLEPTAGDAFDKIYDALKTLSAQGSTAGESAIRMGYESAEKRFNPNGINRILLATDGDFNVGMTDFQAFKSLVADKRKTGISLTTLGFGTGNYNDEMMEQIADAGDGNYSYIDNLDEAKKVLVRQLSSTLATVAKDVKLQIEFNPATVKEYRLVGYENRVLQNEDFNNDKVDAGDIGAGHNVTAFYEIIPAGEKGWLEDSRYQKDSETTENTEEYAWLKLRYKPVGSDVSTLIESPITKTSHALAQSDASTRFAIAMVSFAQALKGGKYNGEMTWRDIINLAEGAENPDDYGLRKQAIELMKKAKSLGTE